VISSVERVSQRDLAVRMGPRRAGDPAAIVARAERISAVLGWKPSLADLDTMVGHALTWEQRLNEYRAAS
jgi:UDP-glucose 4-epimerase